MLDGCASGRLPGPGRSNAQPISPCRSNRTTGVPTQMVGNRGTPLIKHNIRFRMPWPPQSSLCGRLPCRFVGLLLSGQSKGPWPALEVSADTSIPISISCLKRPVTEIDFHLLVKNLHLVNPVLRRGPCAADCPCSIVNSLHCSVPSSYRCWPSVSILRRCLKGLP